MVSSFIDLLKSSNGNFYILADDVCFEEVNHEIIISICTLVAFFIFDAMTYFTICGPCDKIMMQTALHHFIGIFGIGSSLIRGGVFAVLSSSTIITEISTPFLNGRSLLSVHSLKSGILFYGNSILFLATYFLFRFLYLTWLIIIVTRYLFLNPKVSCNNSLEHLQLQCLLRLLLLRKLFSWIRSQHVLVQTYNTGRYQDFLQLSKTKERVIYQNLTGFWGFGEIGRASCRERV